MPIPASRADTQYIATFDATFNDGFGGLPVTHMIGTYTFSLTTPSITDGGTSAFYYTALQSGTVTLNGSAAMNADLSKSYLRVIDNIVLNPTTKRDGYYSILGLSNLWNGSFLIQTAGLSFEQKSSLPTALTSLTLPTATVDLSGFLAQEQTAVLVFKNLSIGNSYADYVPVSLLSITAVPEPSEMALIVLGGSVLFFSRAMAGGRRIR